MRDEYDGGTAGMSSAALLAEMAVDAAGVDGAAVAVIAGNLLVRELIHSTDSVATRIDELQFTIGEGPCLDAFLTCEPHMVPDLLDRSASARWPAFASAVVEELEVRSVFAFPLTAGDAAVGSLELYRTAPGELTVAQHTTAATIAAMIGPALVAEFAVARPLGENIEPEHGLTAKFSRAEVYSAIGMLAARLRIPIDDAAVRRRAHAYADPKPKPITGVARELMRCTLDPELFEE
jgi:hypothetical protein